MNYDYSKSKLLHIDNIFRKRKSSINRFEKLRFDRQEITFPKEFINKILGDNSSILRYRTRTL